MNMHSITPLESRYSEQSKHIADIFSDFNVTKAKVNIEIEYYKMLCNLSNKIPEQSLEWVQKNWSEAHYNHVKDIEKKTQHDIKAIEYFIKSYIKDDTRELVHFGLTSQDINSLTFSKLILDADKYLQWRVDELHKEIDSFMVKNKVLFCARTHGQPAVPTSFAKEFKVYEYRLNQIFSGWKPLTAKFGGANGDLLAHKFSGFKIKEGHWEGVLDNFVEKFSYPIGRLQRSQKTTQVDNNIYLAEYFENYINLNNCLINLSRDVWMYTSLGLLKQKTKKGEIGSSVMPQKVNPINFENAEGNLEFSNAILNFMKDKIQISRMQRDLSDTTVFRNFGVPLAHMCVAIESLLSGLNKIEASSEACRKDLEKNWSCVTEGVQTILRINSVENSYEIVKDCINKSNSYKEFCDNLFKEVKVDDKIRNKIESLTPEKYFYGIQI